MADANDKKETRQAWSSAKSSIEFLVSAATVVYALGYLSWATYSWEQGLGLPPALEGQYVIAGIVPALLLVLLWLAIAGLEKVRKKLGTPAKRSHRKLHQVLKSAGSVLIVCGFVAKYAATSEGIYGTLISAGVLVVLISLFFSSEKTDRLFARGLSWYGLFAAVGLSFALMGIYVTRLFPYLAAEFGGPEISCVTLDLKRSELSEATLKLFTERTPSAREPEMIHSRPVKLLSPPGRYYLIAMPNTVKTRFVKMNTELIHAIVPSDRCAISAGDGRQAEVSR